MPGTKLSGLFTNGIAFLTGVSQLAARAADAVLNPRYFRKSLLDAPELSSSLPASGLTDGRSSLNSSAESLLCCSLSLYSEKLCQYFLFAIYIFLPRNSQGVRSKKKLY